MRFSRSSSPPASAPFIELIDLYWQVGQTISRKIDAAEWGDGVVDQLAAFLARTQPGLKGFTRRNLFRMRQFYEAYRDETIVAPLVRQLPWTHNLIILSQSKRPEERQFYLHLAAKEQCAMHIDTPEFRYYRARYINAVTKMDDEIGIVYEAAKKHLGIENTFFLQTSDHGAQLPFGKWNLYDEGIRVPLIVQWQGHVAAGARTGAMAQWIDILPTLIEVGGGTAPSSLDGRSLLPVLTGKATAHREAIFTTHSNDYDMNVYPSRSMRTAQWKYIRILHPEFRFTSYLDRSEGESSLAFMASWEKAAASDPNAAFILNRYRERPAEELYDLDNDPFELNNLAAEEARASQLATMREGLDAWMKQTGDQQQVAGRPLLLTDEFKLIGRGKKSPNP